MAELTPENDLVPQKFASGGETATELAERISHFSSKALPVGIKTPMSPGYDDGLFKMHRDFQSVIADNLRNMIQTNHGERLGLYDYGANLQPLLLANAADFESKAMTRISQSVGKYMPYIRLESFIVFDVPEDSSNQSMGLRLTYSIPSQDQSPRVLEIVMKAGI